MKIHGKGRTSVMAVCDENLLGRILKKDEIQFRVSEDFFGGEVTPGETILRTVAFVTSINAVGEDSVSLFIGASLADEDSVIFIEGIPHIQIYIIHS
ncbi:hypothetical protein B6U90_00230 [Thermoplasmatales archaeon ex4484_6]|nr:MAG: hypothetical protein B6U90_00230 [Thermoplasmatales archaeon ex4484_6]